MEANSIVHLRKSIAWPLGRFFQSWLACAERAREGKQWTGKHKTRPSHWRRFRAVTSVRGWLSSLNKWLTSTLLTRSWHQIRVNFWRHRWANIDLHCPERGIVVSRSDNKQHEPWHPNLEGKPDVLMMPEVSHVHENCSSSRYVWCDFPTSPRAVMKLPRRSKLSTTSDWSPYGNYGATFIPF